MLKQDVTTRWNSTHDMVASVLKHLPKYHLMTSDERLLDCRLDAHEVKILEQLCEVLEVRQFTFIRTHSTI